MTRHATFEQQYDALRHGCGMVVLEHWSSVTLTGADRKAFFNNFCTNDVKILTPGESCEAFVTNVKGRILAHGLVSCRENELVFLGTPNQSPRLIEHLDRYVIREDVQLRDTTAERKYVLLSGQAPALSTSEGHSLVPWNLIGGDNVGILELSSHAFDAAVGQLADRDWVAVDWHVFTAARIEAGTPLFGVDFDEHNFPQEVGRDREAISFTKGCYLGQETVARIDALGHVNQKIVGVRFFGTDVPSAGAELSKDGAKVGAITAAAFSPRLGAPLALAMVRREANTPGTRLDSPVGKCEVVALPV
ncbi:MAG: hypothetical protein L0228_04915 [Planctomycetes bacterium]|nr:hypothetical protein [Planctomycetota bacterium]